MSSVVAAILMEPMPDELVSFKTDLILGKRKKSQQAISEEYGGVAKLQCSFLRETDEYSGLCEQERYRNGASMCGLPKSSASCHAPISRGAEDCLWLTV